MSKMGFCKRGTDADKHCYYCVTEGTPPTPQEGNDWHEKYDQLNVEFMHYRAETHCLGCGCSPHFKRTGKDLSIRTLSSLLEMAETALIEIYREAISSQRIEIVRDLSNSTLKALHSIREAKK